MVAPSENGPQQPKKRRKKNPVGRPTNFQPENHPRRAREIAAGGFPKCDIAIALGITVSTLYEWREAHPEFAEALEQGARLADDRVEEALYKRATGYEHPDTHIAVSHGRVIKTKVLKHYPASETAAMSWLKNRRPGRWKERIDVSLEAEGLVKLTPEEQARLWAANYRANAPIADRIVGAIEMRNVTGTGDAPK